MSSVRLLRVKGVLDKVPFSRTELYNKLARGEFPAPVKLSARSVAWVESEVDEWIARRVEMSRAPVGANR